MKLQKDDKILWDSHFGYDLGIFIRYYPGDSILYESCEIEVNKTSIAVPTHHVFKYTKEKYEELKKEYKY